VPISNQLGSPQNNNNTNKEAVAQQHVVASVPVPNIRHEWYQSGTHVTISVLQKKLNKDDVKVTMEPKKVLNFFSFLFIYILMM
jgi:hypothetical protein